MIRYSHKFLSDYIFDTGKRRPTELTGRVYKQLFGEEFLATQPLERVIQALINALTAPPIKHVCMKRRAIAVMGTMLRDRRATTLLRNSPVISASFIRLAREMRDDPRATWYKANVNLLWHTLCPNKTWPKFHPCPKGEFGSCDLREINIADPSTLPQEGYLFVGTDIDHNALCLLLSNMSENNCNETSVRAYLSNMRCGLPSLLRRLRGDTHEEEQKLIQSLFNDMDDLRDTSPECALIIDEIHQAPEAWNQKVNVEPQHHNARPGTDVKGTEATHLTRGQLKTVYHHIDYGICVAKYLHSVWHSFPHLAPDWGATCIMNDARKWNMGREIESLQNACDIFENITIIDGSKPPGDVGACDPQDETQSCHATRATWRKRWSSR